MLYVRARLSVVEPIARHALANVIANFLVRSNCLVSQAHYLIDWIELLAPKHLGFFRDLSLMALTISPPVSQ